METKKAYGENKPEGELIDDSYNQIQGKFVAEVIKEWDEVGQGNFAIYVKVRINQKWQEYGRSN